jgi:hypothetical protein
MALHRVERFGGAPGTGEDEGALDRGEKHRRLLRRCRWRGSKLGVDVGDGGVPLGQWLIDVNPKIVVVCGVDDRCGHRAAQREIMVDEEAPPRFHDHADRVGEGLGLCERDADFVPKRGIDDEMRVVEQLKAEGVMTALYRRSAGPGVVILLEGESIDAVRARINTLPFVLEGLMTLEYEEVYAI